ncbi:hypothetical protein FHW84_001792 [Dyella sp. SG562]|uniref:hypothetical protein n=1 Tax=Dyella sp. SG562 TaxID=2587017 RepID=UPI00141E9F0D|nr:hypothetical protein [Dyella sp. SG562]NII73223.1 hypothetical protein [Dyella sp. SG562]
MQTDASKTQQQPAASVLQDQAHQDNTSRLPAIDDAVRALFDADFPNTAGELVKLGDEYLALRSGFHALYHAYVAQLEDSAQRIIDLGGSCHPVEVLEQNDPALMVARALLARLGGAA